MPKAMPELHTSLARDIPDTTTNTPSRATHIPTQTGDFHAQDTPGPKLSHTKASCHMFAKPASGALHPSGSKQSANFTKQTSASVILHSYITGTPRRLQASQPSQPSASKAELLPLTWATRTGRSVSSVMSAMYALQTPILDAGDTGSYRPGTGTHGKPEQGLKF